MKLQRKLGKREEKSNRKRIKLGNYGVWVMLYNTWLEIVYKVKVHKTMRIEVSKVVQLCLCEDKFIEFGITY